MNDSTPRNTTSIATDGARKGIGWANQLHRDGSGPDPFVPIAVCGMALRAPGGVHHPEDLWTLLLSKGEGRSELPADRFSANGFYWRRQPKPGTINFRHGHFLSEGLAGFDASFFSMSRREVERLDPQQRLLLEVVHECMESAGETKWHGRDIGCMVGSFGQDWSELSQCDKLGSGLYTITGQGDFLLANRVSYEYDLKGPSLTVKTACSSAAVAFHLACGALAQRECEGMIVGGTSLITAPGASVAMTEQGLVSPEGRSKPFDASADGYARAEAINAVYLRRLDDAIRDGTPIRVVVRGSALNCDGKSASLASPSSEAHKLLIRKAYAGAGLRDPRDFAPYVECHGTGTQVGDPLETAAIADVSGDHVTYLGSIKSNIGHSEGASFISSMIKAILALEKKLIPPNLHFNVPNPKIPLQESSLVVPVETTPWPKGRPERASINSFGLGGANAHIILDSASSTLKHVDSDSREPLTDGDARCAPSAHLCVVSANRAESAEAMMENANQYLKSHPAATHDLAYTLSSHRDIMQYRTYRVVSTAEPKDEKMLEPDVKRLIFKAGPAPSVSFVFTGQGAQWPEMGKSLIKDFPVFADRIANLDEALARIEGGTKWTITEQLMAASSASSKLFDLPAFSQPLCTAVQIGLVDLWVSLGIKPDSVVGHSSGEIAAAYAAGAITAEDAITIAYHRGQLATSKNGAMIAVGLGADDVGPFLVEGADIACENSSSNVTISGDAAAVELIVEKMKAERPDVVVRRLRVRQAYHSHHMKAVGSLYYRRLSSLVNKPRKPVVPFFSSTYGRLLSDDVTLDAGYWQLNLECRVRFAPAIRALVDSLGGGGEQQRVMLEIGPHGALAAPLRQLFSEPGMPRLLYTSSLSRGHDSTASFLDAVGQLWTRSCAVDLVSLYPRGSGNILTDLPLYAWYHGEENQFWEENRIARQWRQRTEPPHEILGSRVLEWNGTEPAWRNFLAVQDVPWIRDHKINDDIVFPAAAYIAMAGEAVRQLTGVTDYTLRDVVVGNALVLDAGTRVEVMTTLRKASLTITQASEWYDFSISSSHDGESWARHCWGQVLAGQSQAAWLHTSLTSDERLSAIVDARRWYNTMSRIGLKYTGSFQGLENLRASSAPGTYVAAATVRDYIDSDMEYRYQLHPATVDRVFQLLAVALARGQPRLIVDLAVPTYVEHIYVGSQAFDSDVILEAKVVVEPKGRGGMVGSGCAFAVDASGQRIPRFQVTKLVASRIDTDHATKDPDPHAAVQLDFKPLFDYVDTSRLIRTTRKYTNEIVQLEKLFVLSAVDVLDTIAGVKAAAGVPHMAHFIDWIADYVSQLRQGHRLASPVLGDEVLSLVNPNLNTRKRRVRIQHLFDELLDTEIRPYAIAVNRNRLLAKDILEGSVEPLEVLMEDGNLHKIYDFLCFWDYTDLVGLLGQDKPTLRVLEIGAGTGGTTGSILEGLQSEQGERLYSRYTYTDVSAGFFAAAKERFAAYGGIEYKVLDISRDPASQGFQKGSYDLIVAANVLHATPSLGETLRNVRWLLGPGGRLMLQELNPEAKCVNFIFGVLPGWWLGADDGRMTEPYVSPDRWDQELRSAGFGGTDVVVYDNDQPFQINATILATAATTESNICPTTCTVLINGVLTYLQRQYATELENGGFSVKWENFSNIGKSLTNGTSGVHQMSTPNFVVSLLEVEDPFLDTISGEDFDKLVQWLCSLQGQAPSASQKPVFWVTKSTQLNCVDPRYAEILGLARVVRTEMGIPLVTIEVGDTGTDLPVLPRLIQDLRGRIRDERGESTNPDYEVVISDGVPYVGRFHWISVREELKALANPLHALTQKTLINGGNDVNGKGINYSESTYSRLEIGIPGLLRTLSYVTRPVPTLREDEVLIHVHATGLNFKDVLVAMGIVENPAVLGTTAIGIETAGVVEAVGPAVSDLRPGDSVMAVGINCFATKVICSEATCVRIPDELSFVDAATMPCTYATVIRALIDVAKIEEGDTVLVHSACGGVGIAAINICRMVGTRILATVGTAEKRRFLEKTFEIPSSDIFDSRSPSFLPGVMRATDGRGVDVCLNSLSGELLHYSWQCVAPFGTMVEIGKRDLIGHGKLSLEPFEDNRSYSGVDLSHLFVYRPKWWKSLLERTVRFFCEGKIKPISPVKVAPAGAYEDMFRDMQRGNHIGKIVLDMTDGMAGEVSAEVKASELGSSNLFKTDASYILTGGLGGLGRSTARWMVHRGARNLVFIARRPRSDSSVTAFFGELEASRCRATLIQGSVANLATVEAAIQTVSRPVAGVVHGAMVLKDHALRDMTFEDWQTALEPRVTGAWNLHKALQDASLDFFVTLGSFSGMVGQPGQANYAASNTFLDAFVQYRHGLGLPASILDMGPISDVGYVAESPTILSSMKESSTYAIGENEYLDALQLAIARSRIPISTLWSQTASGLRSYSNPGIIGVGLRSTTALDDPGNRLVWRRDIRLSIYRNLESTGNSAIDAAAADNDQLRRILALDLSDASMVGKIAREIGRTLLGFLLRQDEEVQVGVPLAGVGVDSLVAIELRNWCRQHLSLDVSVLKIMQLTLEQLAALAVDNLRAQRATGNGAGDEANGAMNGTLPEERRKYDQILEVKIP